MVRKYITKDDLREGFFGKSHESPDELVDEDIHLKVTLLLPKDTLAIMDAFVKETKVGSRGRLIQLLLDDIWQLQGEYQAMHNIITNYANGDLKESQFVTFASIAMTGIVRRLGRYYPRDLVQPQESEGNQMSDDSNSVKGKPKDETTKSE